MRLVSRSLLVCVLGVVLGVFSQALGAVAGESHGEETAQGGSLLGAPLVVSSADQLLLAGEQAQAAREAKRSNPVAAAARRASRTSFEGFSPGQAASEARAAFPGLIEQPAGGPPRLPAGQHIVRYATDNAAQVSLPGGNVGMVESLAPIATKTSHGQHAPLDLRLEEAGGGNFQPVLANVGVHVPKDLANGVSLLGTGVSLTPIDKHRSPLAASAGALDGAAVLWSDAEGGAGGVRDLATLAKASPEGFDLTSVLLSQRSPGTLYFRVGMPAGAHLDSAGDGSARVVKDGSTLASVSPVSAQDAEGSNVPVSMVVHGDVLAVTVDLSGDHLYPIAVDPEVVGVDSQLVTTSGGKPSNWVFETNAPSKYEHSTERVETKGIAEYQPGEVAFWRYRTQGVSKIYGITTVTSGKNKNAEIESFLEFEKPGGSEETKKVLSTKSLEPEYENKSVGLCAANGPNKEETVCLSNFGTAGNTVHFQQSPTAKPGSNYKFSDSMSQATVSISEPAGTHSTTSFNEASEKIKIEIENAKKEKETVERTNVLHGTGHWLSGFSGAFETIAKDTGIGVAATKLEYEYIPGKWESIGEHEYLEKENACMGIQCYVEHSEKWTLPKLPDGEDNIRYSAKEAISGTESLPTEGLATVKVDTKAPHGIELEGLPWGSELSERPYELTVEATDGEGTTTPSSGMKSLTLSLDGTSIKDKEEEEIAKGKGGKEAGKKEGECSTPKGECTASAKWTINGAELGAGHHSIQVVALDNAGNEGRLPGGGTQVSIRHSTPVAIGPGSVDLQSGDFSLGASDVSLGSGLTVGRTHSSRAVEAGIEGPLGPQWSLSLANSESLVELVDGSVLLTDSKGRQSIFAKLGGGKFESPVGDSNLKLTLEEDAEKHKLAYYLENPAAHTKDKFTLPSGGTKVWVPTRQEGTVATDTVTYSYQTAEATTEYPIPFTFEVEAWSRIVAGSDGNLWFTGDVGEAGRIGKIGASGAAATGYAMPQTPASDITSGPDGNLWFVTYGGHIGKITTSGQITEYQLHHGGGGAITKGPDGNLWIACSEQNEIDKSTTSGELTQYSVPAGSEPSAITAGPDHNVWFTDRKSSKIGRITPSGEITEHSIPGGGSPQGIVTGPDGSLWFTVTGAGGNKIGKITPSWAVTEYPLPEVASPGGITAGPDGDLWFTEKEGIGKITTAGVISEYSLPAGGQPRGIAAGADGKLWFMDRTTGKVGTITTSGTITEPTEALAPVPTEVSCAPTMKPGCRALKFKYATETTAKGEAASEWGQYKNRLIKVLLDAYNPSSKAMQETAVAEYSYDQLGRLRAEWDPRTSPNLKTTYGYDPEGHVTALDPPGLETWAFTYGTAAKDQGTGRLMKVVRPPASESLWGGGSVTNTSAPVISGSPNVGVRMTASNGTWSGSPFTYGYQWEQCDTSGNNCTRILGATNQNYTPTATDLGHTLVVVVTATSGGGSAASTSGHSGTVVPRQFTEYTLPSGSKPYGITAGPDGKMWFTNEGTHKVGKIATSGGATTEYPAGETSAMQGITTGPDGNLWFVQSSTHIDRITTSGTRTDFTLPTNTYTGVGIASGPDGNLWFTEAGLELDKVAKMSTTSGEVIAQYGAGNGPPEGIAAGPDGNMWVAQSAISTGNAIAKYTTSGTKTSYSLPTSSHPRGIVAGPDGNMWFTESGTSKVGKITTSGTISEYALPGGSEPQGIAAGADGKLYVAEYGTSKLAQVTTAGAITQYALPAGSQPEWVAAGPDGCVWVTERGTSKLLKFDPNVSEGSLTEGEAKTPQTGSALEYGVPLAGGSGLQNITSGEVAKWGQSDVPLEATAIVAPDEPQGWPASSYKRATAYYLDEHGRTVNVATPSSATYGAVATTEYNEFNDVIRTLSPGNRQVALEAGSKSIATSKLLDTQNTYNGEGAKEGEVEEPGTRLIESFGPEHEVKYTPNGFTGRKESLARLHTKYFYDEGAPGGEKYDLVTETSQLAQLFNGEGKSEEEVEVRKTTTSYSGQSNLGWKLRAPTSVTSASESEGLKLKQTTLYDSTTGQITETQGAAAEHAAEHTLGFAKLVESKLFPVSGPWGIALDAEGYVWMVDTGNSRVDRYTPTGKFNDFVGSAGSEPGKLSAPEGLALDSTGDLWVADTGNNRVEEFSKTGTYLRTVGSLGSEPGKLKSPAAVAFDSAGNLWVADTGNSRIEKFNSEGTFVSEFGSPGSESGQLKEPKGLTFDSGGHVWVSDTGNNRVQEFSTSGSVLGGFGSAGEGPGQLNGPTGLRFDGAGNLWVADTGNNRVDEFSSSGSFIKRVGSTGTEPGQLKAPRAVTVDAQSNVWVSDSANNRGEEWSPGGGNAHEHKIVYYGQAVNKSYTACGEHPEWAGLVCETLPAEQAELVGASQLPVTKYTYNMWNEPLVVTETFGTTVRTKTNTYDEAGRLTSSETTSSADTPLPKVTNEYNSASGVLEKQSTTVEGKTKMVTSKYNKLGQRTEYIDADGNTAKYKYAGPENDGLLEEISDGSGAGTGKQTYTYNATTKRMEKLTDSSAGTFTASYDAEGKLTSETYPNGMCANDTYNSVGEATHVEYIKTSNCSEHEPGVWFSETRTPSVRGETFSRTSTLASENYTYDRIGRLIETQETPAGEGCTTRLYGYDEESNRTSQTTRGPGGEGKCATEGGTVQEHTYDEGNRMIDGGIGYDSFGNVTKLPAADAEGHELTSTFYVDGAVATQSQNGVSSSYYLDPEGRVRETISGATTTISHYDAPGEAVAWTSEGEGKSKRDIPGIDGALAATQTNSETPVVQLHDLQGNVVATIGDKAGETKLLSTYNSTEFGVPNAGKAPPTFAWLGAGDIASSLPSGVITYGATSYVPQTGRALQSEQVEPPGLPRGSGAGAPYTMQVEPWEMQGAEREGAEAPGLEAARERAAAEAAERAVEEAEGGAAGGGDPTLWMRLTAGEARTVAAALRGGLRAINILVKSGAVKSFTMEAAELIDEVVGEPGYGLNYGMAKGLQSCYTAIDLTRGEHARCKFGLDWEDLLSGKLLIGFEVQLCWGQPHNYGGKVVWTYPHCTRM